MTGIEKVTAFVTHSVNDQTELLLFEHPYAGIQIPAETVEPDEAPEVAAVRETHEETGLRDVAVDQYLGGREVVLPDSQRMIIAPTRAQQMLPGEHHVCNACICYTPTMIIVNHRQSSTKNRYGLMSAPAHRERP